MCSLPVYAQRGKSTQLGQRSAVHSMAVVDRRQCSCRRLVVEAQLDGVPPERVSARQCGAPRSSQVFALNRAG
jgi:hypothetical protein